MPIMEPRHDFAHPVEPDSAWSESYYFNCYDPLTQSGFYTRIGIRPHEGTMDVGISVWLPEGGLAVFRAVKPQHEMVDDDLKVSGVCYERIEPMHIWEISCDVMAEKKDLRSYAVLGNTKIEIQARFEALAPAIGGDGQNKKGQGASAATRKSVGSGHLEQAGRWSGHITIDGTRHDLQEARGNRDKSWGARRWGGPTMWRWFSINFGDDLHFGGILIGTEAGELHRGWVWKDGKHSAIKNWQITTEMALDGICHQKVKVAATDKLYRVHHLEAELLRVPVIPFGTEGNTIMLEGLACWRTEGLTGFGIAEYLHQISPDGKPLTPVQ